MQFTTQDLTDAAILNEFAVDLRYETDDAPSFTSADLLAMADRFRTKLRPLAQAFFDLTLKYAFLLPASHAHRN